MNTRNILIITMMLFSFAFVNCGNDTTKKVSDSDKTKVTDTVKKSVPNTANKDEMVSKISKYRADGEKKLLDKTFKKKTVVLNKTDAKERTKQKWENVDAYYDGDKLVRLQTNPHKGISERTEEFYVMDGKLVFAFIQDIGPKNEGKDTGEPGKELYFDNGKLIKFSNTTGNEEKNADAEMKMYESKLPIEVDELIEIVNNTKQKVV